MADYDREAEKKRIKELIELKKIKQGQIENTLLKNEQASEPMNFKQKRQNFWFYYKWAIVSVIIVLLFISYFVYSILTVEKYDLTVVVSTKYPLSYIQNNIEKAFEKYAGDYDKNGKIKVAASIVNILPKEQVTNIQYDIAMRSKIMGALSIGEPVIFITDDISYKYMKEGQFFKDLKAYNNKNIKGKRFYLKDTDFARLWKLTEVDKDLWDVKEFPKDISISIRTFEGLPDKVKAKESETKKYEYAKNVIENIIRNNKLN